MLNDQGPTRLKLKVITTLFCLAGLMVTQKGIAITLTFSDQPRTERPLTVNPYTELQGLPTGLTATFSHFISSGTPPREDAYDHAGSGDNVKFIYIVPPAPYTTPASIDFNRPAEVPSFWINRGTWG